MRQDRALELLARSYGIQVTFRDVQGQLQTASPDTLLRTLEELGVPGLKPDCAQKALRARRQQRWQQVIEPVLVAWDGHLKIDIRVPRKDCHATVECTIVPDDLLGEPTGSLRENFALDDLPTVRDANVENVVYVSKRWQCPQVLPLGYHQLTLDIAGKIQTACVIAAPRAAWRSPAGENDRLWGVFVPLYALHGQSSWGAGDFSDLRKLVDWVDEQEGDLVATLPLLASQWDFSDDPGPYSPTSRLFWNEFYLDPTAIPEFGECSAAQELVHSSDARQTIRKLQQSPFVDYACQMGLKRRVLEKLTEFVFQKHGGEPPELTEFRRAHPEVDSYAQYRAVSERLGRLWHSWPEPLRSGTITDDDHDAQARRYHLFAQCQVHRQLEELARHVSDREMVWYLDFPLGVHSQGYDVWRYRDLFATGVSGGAPPDAFFTKGQDWGFPPLHPQQIRADGYRYFTRCLRHHLRYAKLLRIDHVMGLHRLYWIPHGLEASQGAYVKYPLDEFMAVLTLESHRHQAVIIGENLGTVPDVVNHATNRHGVGEMYVVQYEVHPDEIPPLRPIPARSVASLNTHDMPSFSAFWTGMDVDERIDLELMTESEGVTEREARAKLRRRLVAWLVEHDILTEPTRDPMRIQAALLSHLGRSDAHVVFATLEDLWQEVEPQNTPGTFKERKNWQRKTRFTLEEWTQLPDVIRILSLLNRERHHRQTAGVMNNTNAMNALHLASPEIQEAISS